MKIARYAVAVLLLIVAATSSADENADGQIRAADTRFWQAYKGFSRDTCKNAP